MKRNEYLVGSDGLVGDAELSVRSEPESKTNSLAPVLFSFSKADSIRTFNALACIIMEYAYEPEFSQIASDIKSSSDRTQWNAFKSITAFCLPAGFILFRTQDPTSRFFAGCILTSAGSILMSAIQRRQPIPRPISTTQAAVTFLSDTLAKRQREKESQSTPSSLFKL